MMIKADANAKNWLIKELLNYQWEFNKPCDVGEYLDYENCKCRKRLVDKLVEESGEYVDEAKLAGVTLFKHEKSVYVFTQFLLSWI